MGCLLVVPAWLCLVSIPGPCPRSGAPWVPDRPPLTPTGLKLQGATCGNNKLSLSNAISTVLPLTQLRWVKQTNAEKKANVVSTPSLLRGQVTPWAPLGH